MKINSLKTYFNNTLLGYYPDSELRSFFNLLADYILDMKPIDVTMNLDELVLDSQYEKFQDAIERLQQYEPIQYIIGETEFFGLTFKVNDSALIPRPETEELVDWIIKENNSSQTISILDIGTGSGCIAISLAKHLPNAKLYALDVSQEALILANSNALDNEVSIKFINADILNWNTKDLKFDVIVSNPPYVRELEKLEMKPNVLNYEPHLALFVEDEDALLFYRRIVELSKNIMKPRGTLFFEINQYLGEEMIALLKLNQFDNIELKKDIFENDRMIKGCYTSL